MTEPCFVLVHGIGTSRRYFAPLARELRQSARVVCIELPGFGSTPKPTQTLSIADYARFVGTEINRLGITEPVLVGQSMGCQVVAELNFQQPMLAHAMVLVSPTVDPRRRRLITHFLRLAADSLLEPPRLNVIIYSDYFRCGIRQYLRTLKPMFQHRIEDCLKATRTRTIVIRGQRDPIVTRRWAAEAAGLPGDGKGNLIEIPRAAHLVHYVQAKEVARICQTLLKD